MKQRLVCVALVAVSVGVFIACSGTTITTDGVKKNDDGTIIVSANDLIKEYLKDEKAADKKYKGNKIRVKGKIRTALNDNFVELDSTVIRKSKIAATVDCFLPEEAADREKELPKFRRLNAGSTATFEGTCDGIYQDRGDIKIINCKVIE
jgi:hypothetical protein